MWRLLEPVVRQWARWYGLLVVVAVVTAGAILASRPSHADDPTSIALYGGFWVTLIGAFVLQAVRRTVDRREGRDALYLKLPVPLHTLASLRPIESALPYAALTLGALLVYVLVRSGGMASDLTTWHLLTCAVTVLALDQIVLAVEEIQVWTRQRGWRWLGRIVPLGFAVPGAALGAAGARGHLDSWKGLHFLGDPRFTLVGLAVALAAAALTYRLFRRHDHPGGTSCF